MKHTPLPWELSDHDANGQRIVRGEHIEICTCWHHCVGSIEKEMEANAAFIVQACNSHDDIVAALEAMYAIHTGEHADNYQEALTKALNKAEAALDLAKGEA